MIFIILPFVWLIIGYFVIRNFYINIMDGIDINRFDLIMLVIGTFVWPVPLFDNISNRISAKKIADAVFFVRKK